MGPATASLVPDATPVPRLPFHRRLGAGLRVLPDFLLLGAQKAGTTDLDSRLSKHPRILPRFTKECRVLSGPRPTASKCRSFQELRRRRATVEREQGGPCRAGDACPYYLHHPRAPKAARRLLGPDLDFIVLLRDPVARAWSHHRHERRLGLEPLDFEAAIAAEPDRLAGEERRLRDDPDATSGPHEHFSYLDRGRYAVQLARWFEAFDRDRFLIIFSEDYFDDPGAAVADAHRHLGLPPIEAGPGEAPRNSGDGSHPPPDLAARLRDQFAEDDERLAELLQRRPPWLRA